MAQKRKIVANATSVGEFFRRPVAYRVPVNQRDFAWTQEEIDVLWGDLSQALDNDKEEYFLGAIVLASIEGETEAFEIVDGQQRLAALSMILAAVKEAWGADSRGQEVFDLYLGSRDRKSREVIPKLSLNSTNDPVYQEVVLISSKHPRSTA